MSISNITATAGLSQTWQSLFQQRKQDFSNLAQALQSGDLAGAQKAYADLQSLQQNSPAGSNARSNSNGNPVQSDFAALGQALASGNLSQAQSDFSKLQSDFKSALQNTAQQIGGAHKGHHHHRHQEAASSQDSSSTPGATTADNSQSNSSSGPGTGVNVTA